MFLYPWGDMHSLNLGWFLLQFKDWVEKIQEYLDNGGGTSENLANVIAPVFNAANSYSTGDYVLYNNELYKANQAVAPGTWDPEKWDSCLIVDEMGSGGAGVDNVARLMIAGQYSPSFAYQKYAICRYNDKLWMANTNLPAGGEAWNAAHWDEITVGAGLTGLRRSVETLANDISAINTTLGRLTKRRFVIIGDSYTEGYSPDNNVTNSWAKLFKQYSGIANADIEIVYRGGAGFVGNSQGKTFIDLLADSAIANPATVTDIIVAGGYNDKSGTEANIKAAISTFCTNAKTKYPNAQVYIAEIGWTKSGTGIYELATLATKYLHGAAENGAVCISGAQYAMHNYFDYFSSDGIHPNQQGQSNIAYQMINFFNGSGVDASYPYRSIEITNCPFDSNNVSLNLGCDMNNDLVNFSIKGSTVFSSTNGVNMGPADGATLFDLGEMTAGYIFGNAYNTIALPVSVQVKNNNVFYWCIGNMVIKNGHIYIALRINDNGDVLQMSSVTSLVIYRSGSSFNSLMC